MNQSMQTIYKVTNSRPTSEDEKDVDLKMDDSVMGEQKAGNVNLNPCICANTL